jgi:hypothetical protein
VPRLFASPFPLHFYRVHESTICICLVVGAEEAFSEYQVIGQDEAEYDFRDFRWAKLEQLRRSGKPPNTVAAAGDETLLEFTTDQETLLASAADSPRLDAINASLPLSIAGPSTLPSSFPLGAVPNQPTATFVDDQTQNGADAWWDLLDTGNSGQQESFPLDWSWLLDESGQSVVQSGDPSAFWEQLNL